MQRIADATAFTGAVDAQINRKLTEVDTNIARNNLVLEAESPEYDKLLAAFAEKRAKRSDRGRYMVPAEPHETRADAVLEATATPAPNPPIPIPTPPAAAPAVRRKRKGPLTELLREALNH